MLTVPSLVHIKYYLFIASVGKVSSCGGQHICGIPLFKLITLNIVSNPVLDSTCRRGICGSVSFSPGKRPCFSIFLYFAISTRCKHDTYITCYLCLFSRPFGYVVIAERSLVWTRLIKGNIPVFLINMCL